MALQVQLRHFGPGLLVVAGLQLLADNEPVPGFITTMMKIRLGIKVDYGTIS